LRSRAGALPGVEPGSVLAGRYRVDRVIGSGGMGIVLKAVHIHLKQPVAIKLLLPRMVHHEKVVHRFVREARLACRLKNEHVARVTDVGTLEGGVPFMVLEYLEGMDLWHLSRSPLTIGEIIDLVLQACEALAEAHSLGIVHRDIKPANLFVTERADRTRLLKVLDFGTSKSALGVPLTGARTSLGTPAYMSPEQIRSSRGVDHRSDLWSLGVVLYQLLQGALPFTGDTLRAMALSILNDPLPELTVPLPGALDEIIRRCLEKDPARRYRNVADLAHAIAGHAGSPTEAALSAKRTRRTLGNVTLELPAACQPACEVAPQARYAPHALVASEPAGVRWSILAATAALACAIGASAAVLAECLEHADSAGSVSGSRK
jgi:serine/threonine-protein kinase